MLIARLGMHVPKGYIYSAIFRPSGSPEYLGQAVAGKGRSRRFKPALSDQTGLAQMLPNGGRKQRKGRLPMGTALPMLNDKRCYWAVI